MTKERIDEVLNEAISLANEYTDPALPEPEITLDAQEVVNAYAALRKRLEHEAEVEASFAVLEGGLELGDEIVGEGFTFVFSYMGDDGDYQGDWRGNGLFCEWMIPPSLLKAAILGGARIVKFSGAKR